MTRDRPTAEGAAGDGADSNGAGGNGAAGDGSAGEKAPENHAVRIRGIYTTALTERLQAAGHTVVQPSDPIRDRFDGGFDHRPADVRIDTSRDREGVELTGTAEAVESIAGVIERVAIDAFRWRTAVPAGAIFDATVVDADGGSGATVDLGEGLQGYLPYDAVDGYVGTGDRYRVQVREPAPPWSDDRPRVEPGIRIAGGLCTLIRGESGITSAVHGERGEELVGLTDLLETTVPDGWKLRWETAATDASLDSMAGALERARAAARDIDDALETDPTDGLETDPTADDATEDRETDDDGTNGRLAAPLATAWCWFGRESRFGLDADRRTVTPTMPGHHRIKTADRAASTAVDFTEAVVAELQGDFGAGERDQDTGDAESNPSAGSNPSFPFAPVARQFGPVEGDRIALGHGKPDGRLITLGTGTVTDWGADGSVTLERSMRAGGRYDGLGVEKDAGDVAVTKLKEGRWWYPTTYKSADGDVKGTYVNVCTPVELFPDVARYVDLYVDVVRQADGSVEIVDEAELAEAVADGLVDEALAEKARSVAGAVERALSR